MMITINISIADAGNYAVQATAADLASLTAEEREYLAQRARRIAERTARKAAEDAEHEA